MPLTAAERKKVHDSSYYVFPKCERRHGLTGSKKKTFGSMGKTSYSDDYAKKEGKPAIPRPCSVTRRNRPHPSQNFLNWRIPSKPMQGGKLKEFHNDFVNLSSVETQQRFYDDYMGRISLGNNHRIVQYPTRPKVSNRHDRNNYMNGDKLSYDGLPNQGGPPLCMFEEAIPNYNKMVANSSSREKVIMEKCLDAADQGMLGQNLAHAIRPEAIPAIHQWLKSQNHKDRNLVVSFLSNLSKNGKLDPQQSQSYLRRMYQERGNSANASQAGRDAILLEVRKVLPHEIGQPRNRSRSPQTKQNQRFPRFGQPKTFNVNKGALFMQPHRLLPGHFEIHPEFHRKTAV